MSDSIVLHVGGLPWQPTPDSRLSKEYRHYDMPLVGVVAQHNREFLFMCLDGHADDVNLWWYVHLSDGQRDLLDRADQAEFERLLHSMEFEGPSVIALAVERRGIVDFEEAGGDDTESLRSAMASLIGRLDHMQASAHELEVAR